MYNWITWTKSPEEASDQEPVGSQEISAQTVAAMLKREKKLVPKERWEEKIKDEVEHHNWDLKAGAVLGW